MHVNSYFRCVVRSYQKTGNQLSACAAFHPSACLQMQARLLLAVSGSFPMIPCMQDVNMRAGGSANRIRVLMLFVQCRHGFEGRKLHVVVADAAHRNSTIGELLRTAIQQNSIGPMVTIRRVALERSCWPTSNDHTAGPLPFRSDSYCSTSRTHDDESTRSHNVQRAFCCTTAS
jgi:hypothetical protein